MSIVRATFSSASLLVLLLALTGPVVPVSSSSSSNETTTSSSCPDEKAAVETCLFEQQKAVAGVSCLSCVENEFETFLKDMTAINGTSAPTTGTSRSSTAAATAACGLAQAEVCQRTLWDACICGICVATYQAYLNCRLEQLPILQEVNCALGCASGSSNGTTDNGGQNNNNNTAAAANDNTSAGVKRSPTSSFTSVLAVTSLLALFGMLQSM